MTCRLLNVRYGELVRRHRPCGFHLLVGVLKSASASEAYRRRTAPSMDPADVVEFLLLSRTFPRSVLFCLRQAERDLARLTAGDALTRPERILGRIRAELEFCDVARAARGRPPRASRSHPGRRPRGVGRDRRPVLPERPASTSTRSTVALSESEADRCGSTSATARGSTTTPRCASRRTSCGAAPMSDPGSCSSRTG